MTLRLSVASQTHKNHVLSIDGTPLQTEIKAKGPTCLRGLEHYLRRDHMKKLKNWQLRTSLINGDESPQVHEQCILGKIKTFPSFFPPVFRYHSWILNSYSSFLNSLRCSWFSHLLANMPIKHVCRTDISALVIDTIVVIRYIFIFYSTTDFLIWICV